jgi:hypothetical protein
MESLKLLLADVSNCVGKFKVYAPVDGQEIA